MLTVPEVFAKVNLTQFLLSGRYLSSADVGDKPVQIY